MIVHPVIQVHELGSVGGMFAPFEAFSIQAMADDGVACSPGEAALWMFRVKRIRVTYDIHAATDEGSVDVQGAIETAPDEDASEGDLILASAPQPFAGFGGSLDAVQFSSNPGYFAFDPAQAKDREWHRPLAVFFSGFWLNIRDGLGPSYVPRALSTYPIYGNATPVTCRIAGEDLVLGESYDVTLDAYADHDDVDYTGSVLIEPLEFWPYQNEGGAPLYDSATGAPTARWHKWFAARQVN